MKYLIFSDLHGDFTKASEMIRIFIDQQFDRIIFLGDLLYHGPRNDLPPGYAPKKVVELLKPYREKIIFIRGNCDAEVDEMVMETSFLPSYDLQIHGKNLHFVHGHHLSRFEPDRNRMDHDVIIYGHYHTFDDSFIDQIRYINIGSVSLPKDGHAGYAVLENNRLTAYDLSHKELLKVDFES